MKKIALNQPAGLFYLFGVEVWERFSYYGMRALLILYFTSHEWGMSDTKAYLTYGAYVAFVYMSPLIGGFVADAFLGHSTSVKYGCVFILIGHLLLVLKSSFFLGLGFVVVGTGFFKSSIAASIGRLYKKNDRRRDAGYTLFYMSVNIGSFFSLLAVPMLAKSFSWHVGFGAAALGMALGLLVFIQAGKKNVLPADHLQPSWKTQSLVVALALVSVLVFTYFIEHSTVTTHLLYAVALVAAVYLAYKAYRGGRTYVLAISAVLVMSLFYMVFLMLFEQTATSVLLFTKRMVNLSFFTMTLSSASLQSLNPFFIIVLAPVCASLWARWDSSVFTKMSLGLLLAGLAMSLFALAAHMAISHVPVSLWWIVLAFALVTMGELASAPVGLSAISKVSPADVVALLFGVWGIKSSFSNYFASHIATFTDVGVNALGQAKAYFDVFFALSVLGFVAAAVLLLLAPWLRRVFDI